ncbi:MAG: winged helix-turn-helix domain-containing protein [Thermoplasmatota archaeon]
MKSEEPGLQKPDIYVVARFLERLWVAGKPMKKTRLQMAVGLNYGTFKKYLQWMIDRQLVVIVMEDRNVEHVTLTRKGLDSYHQMVGWIKTMIPEVI